MWVLVLAGNDAAMLILSSPPPSVVRTFHPPSRLSDLVAPDWLAAQCVAGRTPRFGPDARDWTRRTPSPWSRTRAHTMATGNVLKLYTGGGSEKRERNRDLNTDCLRLHHLACSPRRAPPSQTSLSCAHRGTAQHLHELPSSIVFCVGGADTSITGGDEEDVCLSAYTNSNNLPCPRSAHSY